MPVARSVVVACLLAAVFAAPAHAQELTYYNQQPMYGGGELPAELREMNRQFVVDALQQAGGDSDYAVQSLFQFGWRYLEQGDVPTAMKRFNQAWLVDPEDGRPYWGFAVVTYVRGDGLAESERWFAEAVARLPPNPNVHSDYGRVLEESGEPERAIEEFGKALALDPSFAEAHVGMARAALRTGDEETAARHAAILQELGWTPPD